MNATNLKTKTILCKWITGILTNKGINVERRLVCAVNVMGCWITLLNRGSPNSCNPGSITMISLDLISDLRMNLEGEE